MNYENALFTGTDPWLKAANDPAWTPNWDEDEGAGEFPNSYHFYLPRICNHCTNPACLAACPRGAIYKREEDGIVLVDQSRCRGYRHCVAACPYKKVYFNPLFNRSEKCIFCYPRVEQGIPPACAKQCVGRIRHVGFLDDEAGPVHKIVVKWKAALPLRPDFGTQPNVYYVPPLSSPKYDAEWRVTDEGRIPVEFLAQLFGPRVGRSFRSSKRNGRRRRGGRVGTHGHPDRVPAGGDVQNTVNREGWAGGLTPDFACLERRLIVEIDGGQHLQQEAYDSRRDARLVSRGYRVLRFWDNQVLTEMRSVLEAIREALVSIPPPRSSPRKGEEKRERMVLPRKGGGGKDKRSVSCVIGAVGVLALLVSTAPAEGAKRAKGDPTSVLARNGELIAAARVAGEMPTDPGDGRFGNAAPLTVRLYPQTATEPRAEKSVERSAAVGRSTRIRGSHSLSSGPIRTAPTSKKGRRTRSPMRPRFNFP